MHEDRVLELTNEEFELVREALDLYMHHLLNYTIRRSPEEIWVQKYRAIVRLIREKVFA